MGDRRVDIVYEESLVSPEDAATDGDRTLVFY